MRRFLSFTSFLVHQKKYMPFCLSFQGLAALGVLPITQWLQGGSSIYPWSQDSIGFSLIALGVCVWLGACYLRGATVGFRDLWSSLQSAFFALLVFIPFLLLTGTATHFSIGALGIAFFVSALFFHIAQWGAYFVVQGRSTTPPGVTPIILGGMDASVQTFLQGLQVANPLGFYVMGIILREEDLSAAPSFFEGAPILGGLDRFEEIINTIKSAAKVPHTFLCSPDFFSGQAFRSFLRRIEGMNIRCLFLPSNPLGSLIDATASSPLATVHNLVDSVTEPDVPGSVLKVIRGKKILFTGAGDPLVAELMNCVALYAPAQLICLDASAPTLFSSMQRFSERFPYMNCQSIVGSVQEYSRIGELMAEQRPDLVFHGEGCCAFPGLGLRWIEGAGVDILGTANLLDACVHHRVEKLFFLSRYRTQQGQTSFAMTQRIAEAYCQYIDVKSEETRFIPLRLSNVLGAPGWVLEGTQRQIVQGGPVIVPDPGMVQSFVSFKKGAMDIMALLAQMDHFLAKRGVVVGLCAGEPIRVLELAESMVRLAGFVPYRDIPIAFAQWAPPYAHPTPLSPAASGLGIEAHLPPKAAWDFTDFFSALQKALVAHKEQRCAHLVQSFFKVIGEGT